MRLRTTLMLAIAIALAGCKAATQTPTAEMPTAVPSPSPMPTAVPTALTAQMVVNGMIARFREVFVDQKGERHPILYSWPMVQKDYGDAPLLCEGVRFTGEPFADGGGRAFVCKDRADADKLATYYNEHFDLRQVPHGSGPKYIVRNEDLGIVVQFETETSDSIVYFMTRGVVGLDQEAEGWP